jgi:hypothetical protein
MHDSRMRLKVVGAVQPIHRRRRGRPRKRPKKLHADKAYDSAPLQAELRRRGITPRIARRGIESSGWPLPLGGGKNVLMAQPLPVAELLNGVDLEGTR